MLAIILTGLFLVLFLLLPIVLNRHAVLKVISIFRKHQALCSRSAKSVDQLGLRPQGFAKRLISVRDYKPQALQALIKANIVQVTDDDKLFLAEEQIAKQNTFKS